MYGTRYIFSRHFFRAWVVVTFLIGWAASLVILIMPLWQGRDVLSVFGKFMMGGRQKEAVMKEAESSEIDKTVEEVDEKKKSEILTHQV